MMGRALNFSMRGEVITLVVCVGLSLTLLLLPTGTRLVVADRLGAVLTTPYWNARNYAEDVLHIRDENAMLLEQVAELELMAAAGERMQRDADLMVGPALDPGFVGELVPCRVIMRQRSRFATMIKVHSLEELAWEPWLPVVTREGYLGRVRQVVGPREAWVELLSAPDFALGVELERTGLLGVLRPRGDRFVVEMVGRDEDVQAGDRVITSGIAEIRERGQGGGASVVTPRGFPVGEVVETTSPSDQIFREILVAPAASLVRNETVFVVAPAEADKP
ncbi:rod shape-determining protein MreC [bacterium]|nr:rod shape-determining protein MreC [bacterium]